MQKLNDPIFLILFIATVLGWGAVAGLALNGYSTADGLGGGVGRGNTGSRVTLNSSTAYLLCFVAGAALVLSSLYLMLVRAATKIIMEITLAASVLLNIGIAIYYWYTKYYRSVSRFAGRAGRLQKADAGSACSQRRHHLHHHRRHLGRLLLWHA